MLIAEHYTLIPDDEHAARTACGADRRDGVPRAYIALTIGAGSGDEPAIAPGLILTVRDEPTQRIVQHRDPNSGGVINSVIPKMVLCEDCIKYPARLLGWVDRGELRAELDGNDAQIA